MLIVLAALAMLWQAPPTNLAAAPDALPVDHNALFVIDGQVCVQTHGNAFPNPDAEWFPEDVLAAYTICLNTSEGLAEAMAYPEWAAWIAANDPNPVVLQ